MSPRAPLLEVRGLSVEVPAERGGRARPVEGLSFSVGPGASVGLVGESGAGKSLALRAVLDLLPRGVTRVGGAVLWEGRELSPGELPAWRGAKVGWLPQDARAALNPVLSVGAHLRDVLRQRGRARGGPERSEVHALLGRCGFAAGEVERVASAHPHALSGGMCQRALLAAVLAARPRLLLADEPAASLDVQTQAEVLAQLDHLRREDGMAVVSVSHDLALLWQWTERLWVMHGGRVVEEGPSREVLEHPAHPYTAALVRAAAGAGGELKGPDGAASASGCAYRGTCARASAACEVRPALREVRAGRQVACHHPLDG